MTMDGVSTVLVSGILVEVYYKEGGFLHTQFGFEGGPDPVLTQHTITEER